MNLKTLPSIILQQYMYTPIVTNEELRNYMFYHAVPKAMSPLQSENINHFIAWLNTERIWTKNIKLRMKYGCKSPIEVPSDKKFCYKWTAIMLLHADVFQFTSMDDHEQFRYYIASIAPKQ